MTTVHWIVLGTISYIAVILLALGLCQAAQLGDQQLRRSYTGWRCTDCGTVLAGEHAEHGDEIAAQMIVDGEEPDGAIGCPACWYQTTTEPVTVTIERRAIA